MEGILAIIFIFGGGTAFLLSISPVGKALAERIRHGASPAADPELLAEVDTLRQEVIDLQERMEFTERMLAAARQPDQLGG